MGKCLRTVGRLRGNIALSGFVVLLALLTVHHAETIGPRKDVQISVQRGDSRLFVVRAGGDQVALGVLPEQQDDAKARCGIRGLKVAKNVDRPEQPGESNQLQLYASEYNQLMLSHCAKTNKRKPYG